MSPVLALNGGLFSAQITAGIEGAADLEWLAYPLTDPCQSDILQSGPASGNRMQSIEATRRAKSLPMTDFLHPWPPPSIRGPFAEVAHEAPYHQRGWQVARRNRARSHPFFCQESRSPPGFPKSRTTTVYVTKKAPVEELPRPAVCQDSPKAADQTLTFREWAALTT